MVTMPRPRLAALLASAVGLPFAAAACGGGTQLEVDTSTYTLSSFVADYGGFWCARHAKCDTLAEHLQADCAKQPVLVNEQTAVAAGRATYDPAAAQACMATLGALGCVELFQLLETVPKSFPGTCGKVFHGHVAPGAACWTDAECEDGSCALDTTCPGVCHANKKPGDACTTQDCGYSDHACMGDDRCAPIGAEGDACSTYDVAYCGLGLECSLDFGAPGAKCVPRVKEGASCATATCGFGLQCAGGVCVGPLARGATSPSPTSARTETSAPGCRSPRSKARGDP
jgi:hypothetical protein